MTTDAAIATARNFASLMETAAFAGPVRDRDVAARKVEWYLTQTPYWGGPPPTLEEARRAAKRAWGDDIPEDVAKALA
jgi:hypothetical protein